MTDCCPDSPRQALETLLLPDLFRCLSDPVRLQVLGRLAFSGQAMTVTEVADCCGVHLSGVSRHLSQLRSAGLAKSTKQGREVRYQLSCDDLVVLLRGLAEALERCQAQCEDTSKTKTTRETDL